jgi:hypothetical protein
VWNLIEKIARGNVAEGVGKFLRPTGTTYFQAMSGVPLNILEMKLKQVYHGEITLQDMHHAFERRIGVTKYKLAVAEHLMAKGVWSFDDAPTRKNVDRFWPSIRAKYKPLAARTFVSMGGMEMANLKYGAALPANLVEEINRRLKAVQLEVHMSLFLFESGV